MIPEKLEGFFSSILVFVKLDNKRKELYLCVCVILWRKENLRILYFNAWIKEKAALRLWFYTLVLAFKHGDVLVFRTKRPPGPEPVFLGWLKQKYLVLSLVLALKQHWRSSFTSCLLCLSSGTCRPSRTERSAATPSPARRKTTSVRHTHTEEEEIVYLHMLGQPNSCCFTVSYRWTSRRRT